MKKQFEMNGKKFPSMLAIAKELGKSRVYRNDFDKYGIKEVTAEEVTEVKAKPEVEAKPEVKEAEEVKEAKEVKEVEEPTIEEVAEKEEKEEAPEPVEMDPKPEAEKPKKESKPKLSEEEKKARSAKRRAERRAKKRADREEAKKPTPEQLAAAKALQKKAGYDDIWDWAVDMKKMDAEEVIDLAKGLNLTWEAHEQPRINRMRVVMALREALFPGEKRPKVRKSAWHGIPNEEIEALAKENDLKYAKSDDPKITRMHVIKALKDAGIESPSK